MKKIVDDWRLIYKVCSLYYEDDMRQQEISDYLGISRATISRMLQKGKESGIVRVEVVNPIQFTYGKLEKTLLLIPDRNLSIRCMKRQHFICHSFSVMEITSEYLWDLLCIM